MVELTTQLVILNDYFFIQAILFYNKQCSLIYYNQKDMFSFFNKKSSEKNANGKFKKSYYCIRSVQSGRVLDIAGGGQKKGFGIIYDANKQDNQCFSIQQYGPDYRLKCKTGGYLAVSGGDNGAKLYLQKNKTNNDPKQLFRLDKRGDSYVIYTGYNKVLDVEGGEKKNQTSVIQWQQNGGKNQLWQIVNSHDATSSSSSDLE